MAIERMENHDTLEECRLLILGNYSNQIFVSNCSVSLDVNCVKKFNVPFIVKNK